jgi:diaminopimelate decarboxylase
MLLGVQYVGTDGALWIGGCSTLALAEEHGTPCYLFDEAEIRHMCRAYRDCLLGYWPHVDVSYACKALSVPAMLKIALSEQLFLEVVSRGELSLALASGCPPERLTLHGTYKTQEDLEFAIGNNCGAIVIDDLGEIETIGAIAERLGRTQPVLIRINPDVAGLEDVQFLTVGTRTKFGVPVAGGLAALAVDQVLEQPSLRLDGMHFHLGSQLYVTEPYRLAMLCVRDLLLETRARHPDWRAQRIIAGGGRAVRYRPSDAPPSIADWARAIGETFADEVAGLCTGDVRLGIEPGRSMVAEAGVTLYTVGAIKTVGDSSGSIEYVIVDGGLSDNPRPLMYDAYHEVMLARDPLGEPAMTVTICGRHSEPDIMFAERELPQLHIGDLLAAQTTGAYVVTMSNNFMGFLRPPVIFVNDGESRVVERRQRVDDLLVTCECDVQHR